MTPSTPKYVSIKEYHASFPAPARKLLNQLRDIIEKAAPDAADSIAYNMPTFKGNKNLMHYAAYNKHIGFYIGTGAMLHFKNKLKSYHTTKNAIQFSFGESLPEELIRDIVRFRVEEDAKLANKR